MSVLLALFLSGCVRLFGITVIYTSPLGSVRLQFRRELMRVSRYSHVCLCTRLLSLKIDPCTFLLYA
ncbi:hypothetical protein SISSUDRAFT_1043670 [Sistotremastrum suecicum HHB10207 ss-3]|uniref:Uncharacterized protein n=1 Tax=Sistotremastrum suecicum HHB10207 ss-3 TaxID=1314776 RepID=A0A166FR27_9AGAM|nr:hypothetical protein SISSUDRAFT_1043670 [Sistotremastrum suecicum HHB10207 ss-3]